MLKIKLSWFRVETLTCYGRVPVDLSRRWFHERAGFLERVKAPVVRLVHSRAVDKAAELNHRLLKAVISSLSVLSRRLPRR